MSFFSWLGLRAPKTPPSSGPNDPPTPPDTPDCMSIIDSKGITDDENMILISPEAAHIVQQILETHNALRKLDNLRPSEEVNSRLGALVPLCCEIHDERVVSQVLRDSRTKSVLPSLRQLCSEAESCLEAYWTDRVMRLGANPDSVYEALKNFPYYENYEQLAWFELQALRTAKRPQDSLPSKCAFLGSGPLPLSSLCLLEQLQHMRGPQSKVEIYNVDSDLNAIYLSRSLINRLGPRARGMHFIQGFAGSDDINLSDMDVINLAALVGETQAQKEEIIMKVARQMKIGAVMVVRSARGLRTCLYPEFDIQSDSCVEIRKVLQPITEMHPMNRVVNSAIILRRIDPRVGPEGY